MSAIKQTAIIIGATGLVGSNLLHLLLNNDAFVKVKVFHRRAIGVSHPKLEKHIIDFNKIEEWGHLVTGDVLFSALGTTIKQAGSKEKQYAVDFTYQYEIAKYAANNGVKQFALVSSMGANNESKLFYPKIKGELEEAVKLLPFKSIIILRPSILKGERHKLRLGEKIGEIMADLFCKIPFLSHYKPIEARAVAQAMISFSSKEGLHVIPSKDIAG